ncbi:MAG: FkbM family methyltransferase [Crocinitomicaceae bacterium]|nr:FkbM family methyltransferase [Crocinitomicaceae bacterium]
MAGIFDIFKSKSQKTEELYIPFEGFELCYSEGTSIVERYKKQGHYEQDFVEVLVAKLAGSSEFIDVGANIGMISLSVLHAHPEIKIYAFEPGPHQADLFEKTITKNNLGDKIELSRIALKNEKGVDYFNVHSSEDVSGDGFVDTQRAGKTRRIKVETDTLDNWWTAQGKPQIKFVKMDTEGSEKWILEGAKEFISTCRPILFLEINDKNIKNYPYEISDLLSLLDEFNYDLVTLKEEKVNPSKIIEHIRESDTFIAYPQD